MAEKINWNVKTANGYDTLYPETVCAKAYEKYYYDINKLTPITIPATTSTTQVVYYDNEEAYQIGESLSRPNEITLVEQNENTLKAYNTINQIQIEYGTFVSSGKAYNMKLTIIRLGEKPTVSIKICITQYAKRMGAM